MALEQFRYGSYRWVAFYVALIVAIFTLPALSKQQHKNGQLCRTIPADDDWPNDHEWSHFNNSISGKLIKTVPIASVCHGTSYDEEECTRLRDHWFLPETHLPSSSSPMAYEWSNDSCNPFTEREAPCSIGTHAVYTVNATGVEDYRSTIAFARRHNIRLVIRNSGHDYLGKSSGPHALALWTMHLKDIELLSDYQAPRYNGGAIKVGAGVSGAEAQAFAHSHGRVVVTGNCPTVNLAGGFVQGGGHSLLSSRYGLGADQVLEFEVVTSDGQHLTATPDNKHSDLFWALAGGGGGTYGVVLSMIMRTYPETPTSIAMMTVPRTPDQSAEDFKSFLSNFLTTLPAVLDAGAVVMWVLLPSAFLLAPVAGPNLTKSELDTLLQPSRTILDSLSLYHEYKSAIYPDYPSAFASVPQQWNVSDVHLAGHLVPRSLITEASSENDPLAASKISQLINAILNIGDQTMMVGVSYNLTQNLPAWPVAANPNLRKALFNLVTGLPVNYTSGPAGYSAAKNCLVNDLLGPVRDLAPDAGAYLHEASHLEPNWEEAFYGGNYEELLAVKKKYDPEDVFYARTGVGSHRWSEGADGRLCRVDEPDQRTEHSEL